MNTCEAYESLLAEALFGEMSDAEKQRLDDHLEGCSACLETYREMKATLDVAAARTRHEPSQIFWNEFYDAVADRIAAEQRATQREQFPLIVAWHRLTGALALTPRWAWQMSAAVALIAVGLLLGRTLFEPGNDEYPTIAKGDDQTLIQQAALEARTFDYLGRSKTLLLGLVNFDSATDDPAALNLPRRRKMAGELVRDASLLKSDLSAADQQRLQMLIADLEFILMQIANIDADYDLPEIEMVQTGVDRKSLLFKINVEEMLRMDADIDEPSTNDATTIIRP